LCVVFSLALVDQLGNLILSWFFGGPGG